MGGNGWIIAIGVVGVAVMLAPASREPAPVAAPPQTSSVLPASPVRNRVGNGLGAVVLDRAADGHFYAQAQVNGARVRLLVDTGASSVVLTKADAQRAGLSAGEYSAKGVGAGGEVRLMPVTIARLAIGQLAEHNVPAMVADEQLTVSLLGQSWLSRVGSVTIADDEMVLR